MQEEKIIKEIKEVIDTIRMYIQQDGGDLEYVDYKNNQVTVRILGACIGCNMIDNTYKDGLEAILKEEINPQITVNVIEG